MSMHILEHIRSQKIKEKQHAVKIRELLPDSPYQGLFEQWEQVFNRTKQDIGSLMESQIVTAERTETDYSSLVQGAIFQSKEFVRQLQAIKQKGEVLFEDESADQVLDYIIEESENFIQTLNESLAELPEGFQPQSPAVQQRTTTQRSSLEPENSLYAESEIDHAQPNSQSDCTQPDEDRKEKAGAHEAGEVALNPVPIGKHRLPPLPYAYDALEPYIDEETMRLHHDKHHQSYVDGLNTAEKMMAEARNTGDFALIKHWEREAAFNGAGHYLHTIFWNVMKPDGGGKATGAIAKQIERDFGSFSRFKQHFSQAAEKVEGGGWAILVWSPRSHRLEILQAEKHQNLSQWDVIPLLVLDVWEHAYYLKYKNERAKYVDAWWNTINWDHVNERFESARKLLWHPY